MIKEDRKMCKEPILKYCKVLSQCLIRRAEENHAKLTTAGLSGEIQSRHIPHVKERYKHLNEEYQPRYSIAMSCF
jgi:hypothetical protein